MGDRDGGIQEREGTRGGRGRGQLEGGRELGDVSRGGRHTPNSPVGLRS